MTSEVFGEMLEGDSADMCGGKFRLMSMGGRAEGLACADLGERTPIGTSGNFIYLKEYPICSPLVYFLFFQSFHLKELKF